MIRARRSRPGTEMAILSSHGRWELNTEEKRSRVCEQCVCVCGCGTASRLGFGCMNGDVEGEFRGPPNCKPSIGFIYIGLHYHVGVAQFRTPPPSMEKKYLVLVVMSGHSLI